MGFYPEPTQYHLKFENDLKGLEVTMRSVSVRDFSEMLRMAVSSVANEEVVKSNERMLDLFAKALVDWNLEDKDGKPIPATRKGADTQEMRLITQIINAWQNALVTLPAPLDGQSNNGEISEDLSQALARSSKSLQS